MLKVNETRDCFTYETLKMYQKMFELFNFYVYTTHFLLYSAFNK
jgi:hypothetical protein